MSGPVMAVTQPTFFFVTLLAVKLTGVLAQIEGEAHPG